MQNLEESIGGNFNLSAGGLAIKAGGSSPQFKTANTINFVVDGKFATAVAATAAISFTTAAGLLTLNQPVSTLNPAGTTAQQCTFGVYLSAAGVFSTLQSKIVNAADVANGINAVPTPGSRKGLTLVGIIEIVTTAAATFIPGTTNLDAAGITATYFDCMNLPGNLQTT